MDVVKSKNAKSFNKLHKVWIAIFLAILCYWALSAFSGRTMSVPRSNVIVSKVEQGDLKVQVSGYGILKSKHQQLLSAKTSATVQQIVLKPGAQVDENSIIVRLDNPELQQLLDNAVQEKLKLEANLRQIKLNNAREILDEEANLAQINAQYQTAKLNLAAEAKLIKQGIVSSLNYQRSKLNEAQLKERLRIAKKRSSQLIAVHQEAENIQLEQIKQQQGMIDTANRNLKSLEIRAGFSGVLQHLAVELGQSLSAGQEVALIGSTQELIALINVPQSQINHVKLGQSVEVDTRLGKVQGKITRINPIVVNNTVEVEVNLPHALPKNARPQLNVDANIHIDDLKNVHYIERPANIKTNSLAHLYQLNETQSQAKLTPIQFGRQAGRFIEIKHGLKSQQNVIISDLTNLAKSHPMIAIN